jgi:cell division protein FtsQ
MWDDAQALRKLSNALIGFSVLLALYGALHYTLHLPVFPLRVLQLAAAPQHVDPAQIGAVARDAVSGNFFTADLEQARQAFEKLSWVRKAGVRRQFPWRAEVSLEEHDALARWNGTALVNTHGEVFEPGPTGMPWQGRPLPRFSGQPGDAAEVARMYGVFGGQLAPLGREIVQISLSPRRAWQLRLDDGMVLELGSEQAQQRLERFVAVYPYSLAAPGSDSPAPAGAQEQAVKHVDLRYRNGFAVSFAGGPGSVKGAT